MMALSGLILIGCSHTYDRPQELTELYDQVDAEIEKSQEYMDRREHLLMTLKSDLARVSGAPQRKLGMVNRITREYMAYNSDSALHYVAEAERLAKEVGDPQEVARAKITKADIESHAGLFGEARETLAQIDRSEIDTAMLTDIYAVYCVLYQYEAAYSPEGEYSARATRLREIYTDSLLSMSPQDTFNYLSNRTARDIQQGHPQEVIDTLLHELPKYNSGERSYSILASILANAYREKGDPENYRKYLAITVISDIRGATKENMAIRDLAMQVFEEGDVDRANRYVKSSLDDANFYASRLHDAQLNRILPVIDKSYDRSQQELRSRQQGYLYVLGVLLLIVICGVAYIVRQWRSVEEANKEAHRANEELQKISDRLLEANAALEHSNSALGESNSALEYSNSELKKSGRISEEYIGMFMEYSSLNISLLEKYHADLRKLAMQGNVKGLTKKLDSDEIINETLKAFYTKFDEAVLNIYPQFVERVNSLLREDSRIELKPGEKLNTSLRVLAVMRLGISDPDKVARFLRCSVSTVYTYRSRLKRSALEPEVFESRVMEI